MEAQIMWEVFPHFITCNNTTFAATMYMQCIIGHIRINGEESFLNEGEFIL
jgi:hypothetical protein